MTATLVEVQREIAGLRDHLRSYHVVIDEKVVGQVDAGESRAFEVDPGLHEIFLTISGCKSEKIEFVAKEGQTIAFRCLPNGNMFTDFYWASLGRNRYIRLESSPVPNMSGNPRDSDRSV